MDALTHAVVGASLALAVSPRHPVLSVRERVGWQKRALDLGQASARTQGLDRELTEALWHDPRFALFRRFAVLPSVSRIDSAGAERCVWFTDRRYDLPTLPDTFRYGFCQDEAGGPWRLHRLRYLSERSRQRLD